MQIVKRGRLPLTALRSFEAAGRRLSFSRAAEELFVSQAAISRQIRELEALVGRPLFERLHRRVALTEAGQDLLRQLTQSFDAIGQALTHIQAAPSRSIVRVSSEPFFAGSWMLPRLNLFQEANPDIDIAVDVDPRLVEFRSQGVELAIRHSVTQTSWPQTQSRHLVDSIAAPMMSPKLLQSGPPLTSVADINRHVLLHEDNRDGWLRWFRAAEIDSAPSQKGPIFPDGTLTTRAAALGHGTALGDLFLNAAELRDGALVRPFPLSMPFGGYWLVARDFESLTPAARLFADWLTSEVKAERA